MKPGGFTSPVVSFLCTTHLRATREHIQCSRMRVRTCDLMVTSLVLLWTLMNSCQCFLKHHSFVFLNFYLYVFHRRRLREAEQGEDGQWCIGNNIYSVTMDSDPNDVPLFGAKYLFQLHGVVNVPEYVVHFPLLVRYMYC